MSKEQSSYLYIPGATVVGVVCRDGVVLASEKRISYGHLIVSRSGKKVFKITENVGVSCAGLVSDMQILVREVKAHSNLFNLELGRPISVKATAKMISNLLFGSRLFPLIAQTVVGGMDEKGPSLYVLDMLGSNIPDKYTALGSGAELAIGVLEESYQEGMTTEEGRILLTKAVKSASSRDAMSGDGIDFLIITKDGVKEDSIKI